jgi:hypothetical protein
MHKMVLRQRHDDHDLRIVNEDQMVVVSIDMMVEVHQE